MNDCKYCKHEVSDGIIHEICTNEELKTINKSEDKNIPCIGTDCGKLEKDDNGAQ